MFLRPDNDAPWSIITKHLGQIKNMRVVMSHLRKGVSNGVGKSGIKNSVWSSIRSVSLLSILESSCTHSMIVRFQFLEYQRCIESDHGCRGTYNYTKGMMKGPFKSMIPLKLFIQVFETFDSRRLAAIGEDVSNIVSYPLIEKR